TVVYAGSPGSPLRLTSLDGVGRVASERTVDPAQPDYELARTDYTYENTSSNAIDVRHFVRVDMASTADELTAEGSGANAVRTRTVRWFDRKGRTIAEADLGTEAGAWVPGAPAFSHAHGVNDPIPTFDA